MAKNTGKDFESQFKDSALKSPNTYFYRLKDSASAFNPTEGTGLSFTPSNDYDCFLYRYPYFFPLELKSGKGTSFSFQHDKKDKGKNIKLSQIEGLTKASLTHGVYAGFVFNFSERDRTYWMNIVDFNRFRLATDKKSINENDMLEYGCVLINQELKKVKFNYDIEKMLNNIEVFSAT